MDHPASTTYAWHSIAPTFNATETIQTLSSNCNSTLMHTFRVWFTQWNLTFKLTHLFLSFVSSSVNHIMYINVCGINTIISPTTNLWIFFSVLIIIIAYFTIFSWNTIKVYIGGKTEFLKIKTGKNEIYLTFEMENSGWGGITYTAHRADQELQIPHQTVWKISRKLLKMILQIAVLESVNWPSIEML